MNLNKIKLKVVYLWYDYLTYRTSRLTIRYTKLKNKMDALEVKYMHKEDTRSYWEKIVDESKEHFAGFEDIAAKPSISISEDLKQEVTTPITVDIKTNRFLENN